MALLPILNLFFLLISCTLAVTPTVLWHGMGDSCCNPLSMGTVKREIEKNVPGIYVYSIEIGDSVLADEKNSFIGNINDQLDVVCRQLKNNTQLKNGFNAVGFSQGGQFLRAYAERCNDPPVKNLITFGGQHMGVSDIPECNMNKQLCKDMDDLLGMGAYVPFVAQHSIQAQYFRAPLEYKEYLEGNIFLADINNERAEKNATYKLNLLQLTNLVLIMFDLDVTVVPKESEFFGSYAVGNLSKIVPYNEQPLFTEDWIGLRELNTTGRLIFKHCPGAHMQFTMQYLYDEVIVPYLSK